MPTAGWQDMVEEMVKQDCAETIGGKPTGYYFSQFITVYAEAIRMLGNAGRMTIQYDDGWRVIGGTFN
jgi:hypothetical protein